MNASSLVTFINQSGPGLHVVYNDSPYKNDEKEFYEIISELAFGMEGVDVLGFGYEANALDYAERSFAEQLGVSLRDLKQGKIPPDQEPWKSKIEAIASDTKEWEASGGRLSFVPRGASVEELKEQIVRFAKRSDNKTAVVGHFYHLQPLAASYNELLTILRELAKGLGIYFILIAP